MACRFKRECMSSKILIVEDEKDIAEIIGFNLGVENLEYLIVNTGREALKNLSGNHDIDLIVLDLMLPDISGHQVCDKVKSFDPDLPIIMLTAKGEELDRIKGFETGVDDYLTKPFSVRELILRIKALIRRSGKQNNISQKQSFGLISFDAGAYRVWVNDLEIKLTALEFKLLQKLISNAGKVLSRNFLLENVWEMDGFLSTRTVDTHVKRLREKLGEAKDYIETVRGIGYRMREMS